MRPNSIAPSCAPGPPSLCRRHRSTGAVRRRAASSARDEYLKGLDRDPNNPDLLTGLASVESSLGNFDDALARAKQAAVVDPRSVGSARRVASAYHDLRRFREELPAWDRALSLAPENLSLIQGKAFGYIDLGELDSVHALVRDKLKTVDTTALLVRFALYQETTWTLPPELWPKILTLNVANFGGDKGHWGLKLGHTYLLLGDTVHGRMFGDTARVAFKAQLHDFPDGRSCTSCVARAALGGHRKEATRKRAIARLRETTLDGVAPAYVHFQVARILVQSGEYDKHSIS